MSDKPSLAALLVLRNAALGGGKAIDAYKTGLLHASEHLLGIADAVLDFVDANGTPQSITYLHYRARGITR